jgi:hypothetical protein
MFQTDKKSAMIVKITIKVFDVVKSVKNELQLYKVYGFCI